jgi:hypothetical protein
MVPICHYQISKGNSSSHGFAIVKGIEGSDLAEVILGMKNPCVAVLRGKEVVGEVNLNMLKWVRGLYRLKLSRS